MNVGRTIGALRLSLVGFHAGLASTAIAVKAFGDECRRSHELSDLSWGDLGDDTELECFAESDTVLEG